MEHLTKYNDGVANYNSGNFREAIACYNSVEKYFTSDFEFYLSRGNAYAENMELDKAINDYSKSISLNNNNDGLYSTRAVTYIQLNKFEEALKDLNKAIEVNPEELYNYKVRGELYFHLDNYNQAINDLDYVIIKEPENIEAKKIYFFMWDRITEGYYDFKPVTSEEYRQRGTAKLRKDLLKESISDFDIAIEKDKSNHLAYNARGFAYLLQKEYRTAIADFEAALSKKMCGNYIDNLANAYFKSGEYQVALKYFNNALELNSSVERIIDNRGSCFAKLHEFDKAIEDFTKAIELNENYFASYLKRSWCYENLGQIDKAQADKIMYENIKQKFQAGLK